MKKRQYRRVPVVFPVDVKIKQVGDAKDFVEAGVSVWQSYTSDVSKGGMCLSFHHPSSVLYDLLSLDHVVLSLIISVPYSKEPILAFARIVWRKVSVNKGQNVYLIGVEYCDIVEQERRAIFSYATYLCRRPFYIGGGICLLLVILFVLLGFYVRRNYDVWKHRHQISNLLADNQRLQIQLSSLLEKSDQLKDENGHHKQMYAQLKNQMKTLIEKERKVYYQDYIRSLEEESKVLSQNCYLLKSEKDYYLNLYERDQEYHWVVQTQVGHLPLQKMPQLWCVIKEDSAILWGSSLSIEGDHVQLSLFDSQKISILLEDIMFYFPLNFVREKIDSSLQKNIVEENILDFSHKLLFDLYHYFENEEFASGLVKETSESVSSLSIDVNAYHLLSLVIAVEKGFIDRSEALRFSHQIMDALMSLDRYLGFFFDRYVMVEDKIVPSAYTSVVKTSFLVAVVRILSFYFKSSSFSNKLTQFEKELRWADMLDAQGVLFKGASPRKGVHPHQIGFYQGGLLAYLLCEQSRGFDGENLFRIIHYLDQNEDNVYPFSLIQQLSVLLFVPVNFLPQPCFDYYEGLFDQMTSFFHRQPESSQSFWGVSSSDSPKGYKYFSIINEVIEYEGVVTPYVPFAFLSLRKDESLACLGHYYRHFKDQFYGFYGFYDAMNLSESWFSNLYRGAHCGLAMAQLFQVNEENFWSIYLFQDVQFRSILDHLSVLFLEKGSRRSFKSHQGEK